MNSVVEDFDGRKISPHEEWEKTKKALETVSSKRNGLLRTMLLSWFVSGAFVALSIAYIQERSYTSNNLLLFLLGVPMGVFFLTFIPIEYLVRHNKNIKRLKEAERYWYQMRQMYAQEKNKRSQKT